MKISKKLKLLGLVGLGTIAVSATIPFVVSCSGENNSGTFVYNPSQAIASKISKSQYDTLTRGAKNAINKVNNQGYGYNIRLNEFSFIGDDFLISLDGDVNYNANGMSCHAKGSVDATVDLTISSLGGSETLYQTITRAHIDTCKINNKEVNSILNGLIKKSNFINNRTPLDLSTFTFYMDVFYKLA